MAILISNKTVDPSRLMTSFGDAVNAVVVGASGGVGSAITQQLAQAPAVERVLALSRVPGESSQKVINDFINLEDEASIERSASCAKTILGEVHLIFIATGILHDEEMKPEKALRSMDTSNMARAFKINTTGPALIAKHFTPLMMRSGKSVFAALSARVGSITDNHLGGWYSYRASKAALNQFIRTTAIEMARKREEMVFLSLHPGTTDTTLSRPFQAGVPHGKLFTPHYSANRLLQVIDQADSGDSGALIAWNGELLPY